MILAAAALLAQKGMSCGPFDLVQHERKVAREFTPATYVAEE